MKKKNKILISKIALFFLVIAGLNWGLFGFFNFNLVSWLLGFGFFAKIFYGLIVASAIVVLWKNFKK